MAVAAPAAIQTSAPKKTLPINGSPHFISRFFIRVMLQIMAENPSFAESIPGILALRWY
jgi:hypothetical protein